MVAHGTNLMICKDQKVDLVIFVKIPVSGSDDGLWRDHKAEVFSQESLLCTGAVSIQGLLILFGFPYLDEICQESGGLTIWPFLLGSLVLRVDLILLSE